MKKIQAFIIVFIVTSILPFGFSTIVTTTGSTDLNYGDGSSKIASFRLPSGIYQAKDGTLYVADTANHMIRMIKNGQVTTLAGKIDELDKYGLPVGGYKDGDTTLARFNKPKDMVMDSKGNLFVTDSKNNVIRKIVKDKVYTFAGSYKSGFVNGVKKDARFNNPIGITIDKADNLYVADSFNHAIRKITPDGTVTTLVGKGPTGNGSLDGLLTKAQLNEPHDLIYDQLTNKIYVADTGNNLIRIIEKDKISKYAGVLGALDKTTRYAEGNDLDGALQDAMFNGPRSLSINAKGEVIVCDTLNSKIKIIKGGYVVTLQQNNIPPVLEKPSGIAFDGTKIIVSDTSSNTIKTLSYDPAKLIYKGQLISLGKTKPLIEKSKTLLPIKTLFEGYGAKITIVITKDKAKVTYVKNGKTVMVDSTKGTVLKNKIVYMDPSSIKKYIGLDAVYNKSNNTVTLK